MKNAEWYIRQYETYSYLNWKMLELVLDKLKSVAGNDFVLQIREDEEFKKLYNRMKDIENVLNMQLKNDSIGAIAPFTLD